MKYIKKPYYLISAIIFFGVFFSFLYIDLTSLTIWSINIWDCIFDEGIKNFYQYCNLNLQGIEHLRVGNDLLIYFPWAIWNFPIWLIGKLSHITISTNVWMLTYSKIFLVAVFYGVLVITKKIGKELKLEETEIKQCLYLTGSSVFALTSISYAGQNDILPIFFFMFGLLYLLRGKEIPFFLFAAISIAMKPYMLFSFLIILCLLEKNIWKLFGKIMAGLSLFLLQKIVLINFPGYREAMNSGAANGEITLLLKAQIPISGYEVSVLVLLLGVVALVAYFTKASEEEKGRYIIYYATIPLFIIFAVSGYSFYRPIYFVPLLYLLIIMNKKIPVYFQLFVEIVLIGLMYYQFYRVESLLYNPYYINQSIVGNVFKTQIPQGFSFTESVMRMKPDMGYYFCVSQAVILLGMFLLIILNHPHFNRKLELGSWKNAHWINVARVMETIFFLLISLLGYFMYRYI